ncbi:hypothetical protein ACLOJK_007617 [Asimina triloba]
MSPVLCSRCHGCDSTRVGKWTKRAKWRRISSLSTIELSSLSSLPHTRCPSLSHFSTDGNSLPPPHSIPISLPPSSAQHPDLPASLLHTSNPLSLASLPNFSTDDSSLTNRLKGSRLQEFDVRHYPRAILKMKIADLKLIGKVGEAATPSACGRAGGPGGVPLYIGEMSEIPLELSKAGKDFLEKCFVRDPEKRWTAKMLLNHPFVAEEVAVALGGDSQRRRMIGIEKTTSLLPRSIFYFNSWVFIHSSLRSTVTLADSCRVLEGLRKFGAEAGNRAAAIDFIFGKW